MLCMYGPFADVVCIAPQEPGAEEFLVQCGPTPQHTVCFQIGGCLTVFGPLRPYKSGDLPWLCMGSGASFNPFQFLGSLIFFFFFEVTRGYIVCSLAIANSYDCLYLLCR